MTALLALLAAPTGAAMTTLIGVFAGSMVSRRAQDRHWIREQQATACVRVLRESSSVLVDLSDMDRDRPDDLPRGVWAPTTVDWRPWNEALGIINLVASKDIATAAHAIDAEIWRFHIAVRRGLTPEENWMELRGRVVAAQGRFISVARGHLSLTGDPLQRLDGRPAPDDPIWQTG
ncbi:hypothetical protein ACIRUL_18655 [Streptomyces sp. NPDC101171]|uniref:hypothetical protein n=1 Tax=Streptomyces sp. NPDC101171 TaxID=3366122 RepID=UPI003806FCC5